MYGKFEKNDFFLNFLNDTYIFICIDCFECLTLFPFSVLAVDENEKDCCCR